MDEQHELHDLWQSPEWKAVHHRMTHRIVRSQDMAKVFWALLAAVAISAGLLEVLYLFDVVAGQQLILFGLIPAGLLVVAVALISFLLIHARTHSRRELKEFAQLRQEFTARRGEEAKP
jgi:hypothetical protein